MAMTNVAITQMASDNDWAKNCDKAEKLVREAAAKGAKLVLLQELFDGDYFCIEQHAEFLKRAEEIGKHRTVKRFAALAMELGVVLPVSVFERAGNAHQRADIDAAQPALELAQEACRRSGRIPQGAKRHAPRRAEGLDLLADDSLLLDRERDVVHAFTSYLTAY